MENRTETEHRIATELPIENPLVIHDSIKKLRKFSKFFSNVSSLSVADSTPIETQLELMRALKEVE
jgi:hypothetical protein